MIPRYLLGLVANITLSLLPQERPETPGMYAHRDNVIDDVYLRFYTGTTTKEYVDIQLRRSEELLQQKEFNRNNPTVIYIHGFEETAEQESVQVVVSSYLETRPDVNVILLDWSNMAFGAYFINAAPNTKLVAEAAGNEVKNLVEKGLPIANIHIIGHSLGGQLAGFIGRSLQKSNMKLKRISSLDPAFPQFYPKAIFRHISAQDAQFVDVIHTDAGNYGAPVHTGTADFWPNGGTGKQPGCPRFAPIPLSDRALCSHWRSWRFWAESVRNPIAFPAVAASSYRAFKRENCTPGANPNYIYMGIDADTSSTGDFYLTTNGTPPFGKGLNGILVQKK